LQERLLRLLRSQPQANFTKSKGTIKEEDRDLSDNPDVKADARAEENAGNAQNLGCKAAL
jgi:uncharacterized protein YjbJ (UPF0337 family)